MTRSSTLPDAAAIHAEYVCTMGELLRAAADGNQLNPAQRRLVQLTCCTTGKLPVPQDNAYGVRWALAIQMAITRVCSTIELGPLPAAGSPEAAAIDALRRFSYRLGGFHGQLILAGKAGADLRGQEVPQ